MQLNIGLNIDPPAALFVRYVKKKKKNGGKFFIFFFSMGKSYNNMLSPSSALVLFCRRGRVRGRQPPLQPHPGLRQHGGRLHLLLQRRLLALRRTVSGWVDATLKEVVMVCRSLQKQED